MGEDRAVAVAEPLVLIVRRDFLARWLKERGAPSEGIGLVGGGKRVNAILEKASREAGEVGERSETGYMATV